MAEFVAVALGKAYELSVEQMFVLSEDDLVFSLDISEDSTMADTLNVRIGELYPITVRITPSTTEYQNFTINEASYVRFYSSSGGAVTTNGELVIDNELKTITYIWDTRPTSSSIVSNSPQQYTVIFWADITYQNSDGVELHTLIASDNITKNLIRSSRLE